MKTVLYWIFVCLVANIILFVACALPWYGVIASSGWYAIIAVPCTLGGACACYWLLYDSWFAWDHMWFELFGD